MAVKHYMRPLVAVARNGKGFISMAQVDTLFSSIEGILSINRNLCKVLGERMANWTPVQQIGDIFCEVAENLKTYSTYISNYNLALSTITKLRQNKEFDTWLKDHEAERRQHPLESCLIMPIQV
jgi:hypothetical protein